MNINNTNPPTPASQIPLNPVGQVPVNTIGTDQITSTVPNSRKYLRWIMVEDERIAAPVNPFDPLDHEDNSQPMDDDDMAAYLKNLSDFVQLPTDHFLSLRLQLETLTALTYGETIETGTLKGVAAFPLGSVKVSHRALDILESAHCPPLKLLLRHLSKRWGAITEQEEDANFDALRLGRRIQSTYYLQPYDQDEYAATVERTPIKITTAADRSTTTITLAIEADILDQLNEENSEARTQLIQAYQARYPAANTIELITDFKFETYLNYLLTGHEREESVKFQALLRVRPEDIIASKAVLKQFNPTDCSLLTALLQHLSVNPDENLALETSTIAQRYLISSFTLPTDEETTQSVNIKMITDSHSLWPCTLIMLAEECQGQAMD